MANALARLGVTQSERVATLAWNGYRHLELYYAVSGSGAVLHTLNPRLHPDQVVYIAGHAEDAVLFFDLTFLPLVEAVASRLTTTVRHLVAMTDRAHMPASTTIPSLLCYEDLIAAESDAFPWPNLDEGLASSLCYTSGTTGNPKGRALQPPLDPAAQLRHRPARFAQLLVARRDPAGRADVPRQRLGPALRGLHDGFEAGVPGPGGSTANRSTTSSRAKA